MSAILIAQLITTVGLPFVDRLMAIWAAKGNVAPEEWPTLRALVKTPEEVLSQVAAALGLPADDPKVIEVGELIKSR